MYPLIRKEVQELFLLLRESGVENISPLYIKKAVQEKFS
jgi:hypothetical protein